MSGTVKTVLVVGGVAAGVFLVAKALAPGAALPRAPQPTGAAAIAGLINTGLDAALSYFNKPSGTYHGEDIGSYTDSIFGAGVFEAHGS